MADSSNANPPNSIGAALKFFVVEKMKAIHPLLNFLNTIHDES